MNLSKVAAIVFAIAVSPNSALAQDCASIKDNAKRLECYDKPNTKMQPASGTIARAEAVIRQQLKDPDSAKFDKTSVRTVTSALGEKTTVVCGTVNAKNAFGGYVGAHPFFVLAAGAVAHIVSLDSGSDVDRTLASVYAESFKRYCLGTGYSEEEVEKNKVDLENRKPKW